MPHPIDLSPSHGLDFKWRRYDCDCGMTIELPAYPALAEAYLKAHYDFGTHRLGMGEVIDIMTGTVKHASTDVIVHGDLA